MSGLAIAPTSLSWGLWTFNACSMSMHKRVDRHQEQGKPESRRGARKHEAVRPKPERSPIKRETRHRIQAAMPKAGKLHRIQTRLDAKQRAHAPDSANWLKTRRCDRKRCEIFCENRFFFSLCEKCTKRVTRNRQQLESPKIKENKEPNLKLKEYRSSLKFIENKKKRKCNEDY